MHLLTPAMGSRPLQDLVSLGNVSKCRCVAEKPYEVEHVIVKTEQWLRRTEDLRSWQDKYAGKLACGERGQLSANNVPYKELGQVVLEMGDLITGALKDSVPEDVSIIESD